ncbi:pre-peptidase C-terminal domain-containing protein [Nodosilinea sp. LEGE 07298]|uniref:pre-peptidase C-terminal domain-containing protein n=1 Tax=Nodosilinea sp. LEGE 07298 TaxID=2777970 RepID=UPI0037C7202A
MTIRGHLAAINALAFSPNSKWLTSASEDNSVKFWDLSSSYPDNLPLLDARGEITEADPRTDNGYSYDIYPLSIQAGQTIVVTATSNPSDFPIYMKVEDSSGKIIQEINNESTPLGEVFIQFQSLRDDEYKIFVESYSSDSFGSYNFSASLLDRADLSVKGHSDGVHDIIFGLNDTLISAGGDGSLLEWKFSSLGEENRPIHEYADELVTGDVLLGRDAEAYSEKYTYYKVYPFRGRAGQKVLFELSSNEFDTYLYLEDPSGNLILEDDDGYYGTNSSFSTSLLEDGEYKIVVSSYFHDEIGAYYLAVFASDKPDRVLGRHAEAANSISFDPVKNRLASASDDGTVKVWDVTNGQEIQTLRGSGGDVQNIIFSADGERLVSNGTDNAVRLWHQSQEKLDTKVFTSRIDLDNQLRDSFGIPPVSDGTSTQENCPFERVLSKNSEDSIVAFEDSIIAFKTSTGEVIELEGHLDSIQHYNFSSDCQILATGSADRDVKLWDVQNGRELQTLSGHSNKVGEVYFSSDNSAVISVAVLDSSFYEEIYEAIVWDFSEKNLFEKSCDWLRYYLNSESTPSKERKLCQGFLPTQPPVSFVPGPTQWVANVRGFLGEALDSQRL